MTVEFAELTEVEDAVELAHTPGRKENVAVRLGELPNGAPVLMPVMIVSGAEDGPVLFVNACLHGDEVLTADVLRRTVRALDPLQMRGTVIAVPMANPASVGTRTRRNLSELYPGPHDMNRVFPGTTGGVMAERAAQLLTERFITRADYAFDLHCASVGGEWVPYTAVPPREACASDDQLEQARAFAHAFGTGLVIDPLNSPGSLTASATEAGVAASMAEFGVANVIDDEGREVGMRGLANLLVHLGMIEGELEPPASVDVISKLHRMTAARGGFLIHSGQLGRRVTAGDLLAQVETLTGEVVQEFVAPADGIVCRRNTMGVVGTGDLVVYVGELD